MKGQHGENNKNRRPDTGFGIVNKGGVQSGVGMVEKITVSHDTLGQGEGQGDRPKGRMSGTSTKYGKKYVFKS